jgi:hypothetical protein
LAHQTGGDERASVGHEHPVFRLDPYPAYFSISHFVARINSRAQ